MKSVENECRLATIDRQRQRAVTARTQRVGARRLPRFAPACSRQPAHVSIHHHTHPAVSSHRHGYGSMRVRESERQAGAGESLPWQQLEALSAHQLTMEASRRQARQERYAKEIR